MNIIAVLSATVVIAGCGLLIGVLLGLAGIKFKVEVDEKEVAIREALPGNNCGGCGFAGCDGLAAAIAKGEAPANGCPVGGAAVAAIISEITGQEAESVKKVAFVKCKGDCNSAKTKYNYTGNMDCRQASYVTGGGDKACQYGCLGYGSCVKACDFNAISVVNGIAVVDEEKCVACGKCVAACPKNLVELVPYGMECKVQCNSYEKGKDVKSVCSSGCIGCSLCAKNCPVDAIVMDNNLAHIDYDICAQCGYCRRKCPVKVIK